MFTYINTAEDLSFLGKELLGRPYLGIDTEFRRTTKENMRLALLQVNDGEEIYLIDAILINNPENSCDFLFSKAVKKILHSCKEDLEAIYSWTGGIMVNIFDTQLANSFLDGEYSIGYQGLVKERLEISLDKKETRSNWIRRPLSDSQLDYAASDVEYLIPLFEEQEMQLIRSNKMNWFIEDINELVAATFKSKDYEEEIRSSLKKSEEIKLLNKFHEVILHISKREKINETLFFSKKNQKEFIRFALNKGIDGALDNITSWRKELIEDQLHNLFMDY